MPVAWYMDESNPGADPRLPLKPDQPHYVSMDELKVKAGVEFFKLDADNPSSDPRLARLRAEKGYIYEDQVTCTKDGMPDFEETMKKFFSEHIHPDNVARFILEGSGYFDVREPNTDRWIRIQAEKGDFMALPAGAYHRFTLDTNNYIKANRYFSGGPVWTQFVRPAENHPARKQYMQMMAANTQ